MRCANRQLPALPAEVNAGLRALQSGSGFLSGSETAGLARTDGVVSAPRLLAVVLAAGEGTRMKSSVPKPLHRLAGRPMVAHVLHALSGMDPERVVVVVGFGAGEVTKGVDKHKPEGLKVLFAEQKQQRGTGDAVRAALSALPDVQGDDEEDSVIVAPGDTPLLSTETMRSLVDTHRRSGAAVTLLSARVADPSGYGRVVRDEAGSVLRIVEQRDATDEERLIDEVNTSVYVFRRAFLAGAVGGLRPDNASQELYLTDVVAAARDGGWPVSCVEVTDPAEASGVNDRRQLAAAEAALRRRINETWMRRGVTMIDPAATYVDCTVDLAGDVVLYPGTVLEGSTVVEAAAVVGPATHLVDCHVGAGARVEATYGRSVTVAAGVSVGPWAVLGPGDALVGSGDAIPAAAGQRV